MEELQSTDILDREILEDARKKAYRILKTADETVRAQAAEWEKKEGAALEEMRQKYAEKRKTAVAEILARLPVDKRRAKSERIEALLKEASQKWQDSLDRPRLLSFLSRGLAARLGECSGIAHNGGASVMRNGAEAENGAAEKPRLVFRGISRAEAESLAAALVPGCVLEEAPPAKGPSLVLESPALRISVSVEGLLDFYLHEKRAELAGALVGHAFLEEERL